MSYNNFAKNILVILICVICITFSSCKFIYQKEYNNISNSLSEMTEYCNLINNETEDNIYYGGNFSQLCSMGGWPINYETAKYFRANGSYNNAETALAYVDEAIEVANKINDTELVNTLTNVRSSLRSTSEKAVQARENYRNYLYTTYMNEVISINRNTIQQIERCRRIMAK